MTFINSLALWGSLAAAGVALPILIHLLNRSRPRRLRWAAMELLRRTMQKRSRQVRIEDLVIMLLRALALLLIAIALLRPVVSGAIGAIGQRRRGVVVAIDGSYSMGYSDVTTRFASAIEEAQAAVSDLPAGSPVSLVVLGRTPEVIEQNTPFDAGRFEHTLKRLSPRPESVVLEPNLSAVKTLMERIDLPNRQCVLITDAQRLDWAEMSPESRRLLSEIGELGQTSIIGLDRPGSQNLTIHGLRFASGSRRAGGLAQYTATVTNHGAEPRRATVHLLMDADLIDTDTVGPLEPGEARDVRFTVPLTEPGQHALEARLDPDALTTDDSAYAVVDVPAEVRVLLVDGDPSPGDPENAETFYLATATRTRRSGYAAGLEVRRIAHYDLTVEQIDEADLIVLANVPEVSGPPASALKQRVEDGAGLMIWLGDRIDPVLANTTLYERGLLPAKLSQMVPPEANERHSIRVADPGSPVGGEMARVEEYLNDVRVRGFFRTEPSRPGARVVLEMSDDEPLLIRQSLGRGSVALITTSADRAWSNLPSENPAWPVLVHQLISHMTGEEPERIVVGDELVKEVEASELGATVTMVRPDGEQVAANVTRGQSLATLELGRATEPGIHRVRIAEDRPSLLLAANVEPSEGDVRSLSSDVLRSGLSGTGVTVFGAGGGAATARAASLDAELSRLLALAGLAVMVGQALLSDLFSLRKRSRHMEIRTGFGPSAGLETQTSAKRKAS